MDIFTFTIKNTRDFVQKYLLMSSAIALVIWYIQFLWKRRYLYIHSWKVEGPLSFPIIGCGYLFLGNGTDIMDTILKIQENISSGLWRLWLGPELLYFITKPELIETVLNHPKALNKQSVYKFLSEGFGYGILTAPVQKWKKHRKLLAPAFHRRVLDSFAEAIAQKSEFFLDELKSADGQKDIDIEQFALSYTIDVICHTQMGVNMNIQKEKLVDKTACEKFLESLNYRIFRVWLHPDLFWHFSPHKADFDNGMEEIKKVTDSLVLKKMAERNEQLELKQPYLEADIEEPTYKRLPLLDLILQDSKFTERETQEEIDVFLGAGSDTTATSICCLFTMLGMHPEIQQKVYDEVIDILGPDRIGEASDFQKMKYTDRVIKENLRLFPIVPVFARAIEGDIDLGDVILSAGSSVAFCSTSIHRSPKYWADPLKFDPDRFLPEEVAKRHPCTYIPFSYGPRNCIGWKYAIAMIKQAIATVIRQYRIFTEYKSVEEIQLKISFVLRLTDGPKVWLERR